MSSPINALTALMGAIPSVFPAKTSTGAVTAATSISCPERFTVPVSSWLDLSIRW